MVIEVVIYLVIVLGIIVVAMTMFENDQCSYNEYSVKKREGAYIKVTVEVYGFSKENVDRIDSIIQNGKYRDIYEIANEYEIKNVENIL